VKPPAPWFVYMLECKGGRIYTGVTPDVRARFARHCAGKGGAFTRSFPPRRILAVMRCAGRGEALSTEHALKQLARAEKLAWARQNKHRVIPAKAGIQKTLDARFRGHDDGMGARSRGQSGARRPPAARGSRRSGR